MQHRTSLTPAEVASALALPPELIDLLLDSGRLLCHVQRGEVRIPMRELEAFFRDGLIRVYQTEAVLMRGATTEPLFAPPLPVAAREHETEPEPESEPVLEQEQEPDAEPESEPLPEPEAEADEPSAPIVPITPIAAAEEEEEEEDRPDLRMATRYVPRRQIDGIFGDTKFTIMQLSKTGLRIRHGGSMLPGDEAKLSFALLSSARSVVFRARVVWTSIARSNGQTFSISGLKVIEHQERLARAIDALVASHDLQPERRAQVRRAEDAKFILDGVSDDEVALVMAALQKFAENPVEANRWYGRARFALADEAVRRAAPQRPREREEVLGIWEFLERQVEISKIAGIVKWARRVSA
ncbi:MAG TPA: PilZ domain-containing protein [Thermoanaerobaculia bacterium]|nr:PilZ domain-containing protein [Thermoanaerobaculia bacterium]